MIVAKRKGKIIFNKTTIQRREQVMCKYYRKLRS